MVYASATYCQAEHFCASIPGNRLVNRNLSTAFEYLQQKGGSRKVWIGLTDLLNQGNTSTLGWQLSWQNKQNETPSASDLNFTSHSWANSNRVNGHNCAYHQNGKLNHHHCSSMMNFVCEQSSDYMNEAFTKSLANVTEDNSVCVNSVNLTESFDDCRNKLVECDFCFHRLLKLFFVIFRCQQILGCVMIYFSAALKRCSLILYAFSDLPQSINNMATDWIGAS